jgi:arylsulfatase A-like enzyme
LPTIVEMSGAKLPAASSVDGVSIVPLLRGEPIKPRPLFWHYPHYGNQGGMPGGAVHDGRWKLIQWYEGHTELYDLAADPGETNNLAKEHPDVVNRLRARLNTWRRNVGAKMPSENPRYQPGEPEGRLRKKR